MATADLTRPALGSWRVTERTPIERSAGVLSCAAKRQGYDARMRSAVRPLALPVVLLVVVGLVGACTASSAASAERSGIASAPAAADRPTVAAQGTRAATTGPAKSAAPSEPAATPVGITQTPWGRILDAVPAAFPKFPGATVADPPPGGAVSEAWATKAPVAEVASWYHDALLAAKWAKVDDGGALEDGTHVLDAQGDTPECKAQVTVKALGESTMITVLFGTGCVGGG